MSRLTKNKQRNSISKGPMKKGSSKRIKKKSSAKYNRSTKKGSFKTKQKQGKGKRSQSNQTLINKVKLAKLAQKLGRKPTKDEIINQQINNNAKQYKKERNNKIQREKNENNNREAKQVTEDMGIISNEDNVNKAANLLNSKEQLNIDRRKEEKKAIIISNEKRMEDRNKELSRISAMRNKLNSLIKKGKQKTKQTRINLIDILQNKISTRSSTGCYHIKSEVWKKANIGMKSIKLSRECINALIKILQSNLQHFPNGKFNNNKEVILKLKHLFKTRCLPCKDEGGNGGNNMEILKQAPSPPSGFATTNIIIPSPPTGSFAKPTKKKEANNVFVSA